MKTASSGIPAGETAYCRALFWVDVRGKRFPILPVRSLFYCAIALTCVIAAILVADRYITLTESSKALATAGWQEEDHRILLMDQAKVESSESDPVWRSKGLPYPGAKEGRKRILVLGDSFVWGDGYVNMNDIWWRQLQRELVYHGYWNVDVVAAGRNGASTQDEFGWLRDSTLISTLQPDAIVIGYVSNDPDMRDEQGHKYVSQIEEQPASLAAARLPLLDRTLGKMAPQVNTLIQTQAVKKRLGAMQSEQAGYVTRDWESRILEGPNFDAYDRMLSQMGSFLKQVGIPSFFVTLPNWPSREAFEAKYEKVEPAFASAGISFYDILDRFVEESSRQLGEGSVLQWGINPANGHPGPAATHFYAQEVLGILERDYPGALGQRQPLQPALRPFINDWMPPTLDVRESGAGEWTFKYPADQSLVLNRPIGKDHIAFNFDMPVAIKEIRLSGSRLQAADMYVTAVDTGKGYDPGVLYPLGEKKGSSLSWGLDGQPFAVRVNSLKVAAQMKSVAEPDRVIDLKPGLMSKERGLAYTYPLPELIEESDGAAGPRSLWILLEDGKPVGQAHADHADIRGQGGGRWSHWKDSVYFSSSDGSDPRTNGKKYQMVYKDPQRMSLKLGIVFEEPAVRP